MTKTSTKTATFKTFEAARLAAGKYAGMCISRSEEREAHILEKLRPWCDLGGLLVLNDLEALELGETA